MERILDLVARALGALAGICVVVWGVGASWGLVFDAPGSLVAGLTMLVVGTPLLALLAAALNYWFVTVVLSPLRWVVRWRRRRSPVAV